MTVAPVLADLFEAQNESRLDLGECYIGGEKLVSMAVCQRGLYSRCIARISPLPSLGHVYC